MQIYIVSNQRDQSFNPRIQFVKLFRDYLFNWGTDTDDRPANTERRPNAGLMLVQRHGRWANIKPALALRLVFAGRYSISYKKEAYSTTHKPPDKRP